MQVDCLDRQVALQAWIVRHCASSGSVMGVPGVVTPAAVKGRVDRCVVSHSVVVATGVRGRLARGPQVRRRRERGRRIPALAQGARASWQNPELCPGAGLADLAQNGEVRHGWNDLVLLRRPSSWREIYAQVRYRAVVHQRWGFGDKLACSKGRCVLFAGPPGTGKKTAAGLLAAALGPTSTGSTCRRR
jgi:hypothetical protein